ncbi:MAG: hypothetical protein ABIE23_03185 [archaeon]|nr:hypothetical protein [Candidatus Micrarchaeota archaeon]
MPPYFAGPFAGPILELLIIELAYFIVVVGICLTIYFRTKELYNISQHKGIFYFRNIFLYFAFAYFFRLINALYMLSNEALDLGFRRGFFQFDLLFVSYFSTMAILSLLMAVMTRSIKKNVQTADYILHGIALISSLFVFVTRSFPLLFLVQTIVLIGAVITVFITPQKKKPKRLLSQNTVTYALLAVFWVINLLSFNNRFIPPDLKIIFYLLSIAVFVSIFLRVQKRLPSNAKKEKQA